MNLILVLCILKSENQNFIQIYSEPQWCKPSSEYRKNRMLASGWMALRRAVTLDINYTSSHPILARAFAKKFLHSCGQGTGPH
jgi:hypothetical protein